MRLLRERTRACSRQKALRDLSCMDEEREWRIFLLELVDLSLAVDDDSWCPWCEGECTGQS